MNVNNTRSVVVETNSFMSKWRVYLQNMINATSKDGAAAFGRRSGTLAQIVLLFTFFRSSSGRLRRHWFIFNTLYKPMAMQFHCVIE